MVAGHDGDAPPLPEFSTALSHSDEPSNIEVPTMVSLVFIRFILFWLLWLFVTFIIPTTNGLDHSGQAANFFLSYFCVRPLPLLRASGIPRQCLHVYLNSRSEISPESEIYNNPPRSGFCQTFWKPLLTCQSCPLTLSLPPGSLASHVLFRHTADGREIEEMAG